MKLNKLLLYTFICLIIWLVMSYSTLGNFEFSVLFIIFSSYLVFLVWQRGCDEGYVNSTATDSNANHSVLEEIGTLAKTLTEQEKTIKSIQKDNTDLKGVVSKTDGIVSNITSSQDKNYADLNKKYSELQQVDKTTDNKFTTWYQEIKEEGVRFFQNAKKEGDQMGNKMSSAIQDIKTESDKTGLKVSEEIRGLTKNVAKDQSAIRVLQEEDVVLGEEINVVEEEVQSLFASTMSIMQDLRKMPGEIKHRFGAELDRLIYNVSPKKPNGEYINVVSIDENYFKPLKSNANIDKSKIDQSRMTEMSAMMSKYPGDFSLDEIKKMKVEYMMVDLVLRDLYHYNKDSYNKLFYP